MTSDQLDQFIADRTKQAVISSKSFLVTVLGDVLSVHGDWVWLGSLIEALQGLGYSERLVRTSVFRLVQDDWLQTKKIGRRSYYSLTDNAKRHHLKAARRIYAAQAELWDGHWLLVLPVYVNEPKLTQFRRQLDWLGFSPLAGGIYAHPSFEQQSLEETVQELELSDAVVIFNAKTLDQHSNGVLKQLAHDHWQIEQLEADHRQLLNDYQPIYQALLKLQDIGAKRSFLLRTLLIHEYRRVLLKDHELPRDMLPSSWAGYDVQRLVSQLYAWLAKPSIDYICTSLYNAQGILPEPEPLFWQRFNKPI